MNRAHRDKDWQWLCAGAITSTARAWYGHSSTVNRKGFYKLLPQLHIGAFCHGSCESVNIEVDILCFQISHNAVII